MVDNHDNDITLRELILTVRSYLIMLIHKWKLLVLAGLICSLLSFLIFFGSSDKYEAELSFMLNVDERGLNPGIASLVGQYALGLNATESNPDKILELSRSRTITEMAIFDSIAISGEKDILANHLINAFKTLGVWNKQDLYGSNSDSLSLKDYHFTSNKTSSFSKLDNKALKTLHALLVGEDGVKAQLNTDYNELTGIMKMSMTSPNEELSIKAVGLFFSSLSKYYIQKSTEKQQYEYDLIREKYDSINTLLSQVQYELAAFEDSNKDIYRKQDMLKRDRLRLDQQKLQFMQSKAEEQLQLSKIALDNKTPYVQLIDSPISPLKSDKRPLWLNIIFGFILGLIISSICLSVHKVYKDIINT